VVKVIKAAMNPAAVRAWIGGLARRLYRALPLSHPTRFRLKQSIYRNFPLFLSGTAGYRNWLMTQSRPIPAQEADGGAPPAVEPVPPEMIQLEGADLRGFAAGLRVADCDAPLVSVVIPAFNQF
jgi:hypothetical protein